jgi:hypothetical protein
MLEQRPLLQILVVVDVAAEAERIKDVPLSLLRNSGPSLQLSCMG